MTTIKKVVGKIKKFLKSILKYNKRINPKNKINISNYEKINDWKNEIGLE